MFNKKKLKAISVLIGSGITPSRTNTSYWENGSIPWVKTEQIGEHQIFDSNEKISDKALRETSIKLFPPNTISIAMYGEGKTRGNVSILKKEMTTNQACCNIVLDSTKANYEYVYYYLKTQYHQLRSLSSGVRSNLNSNDIKEYEVRLPNELHTQEKIASVLSSLDSKIELNNKINDNLEQIAKTLYDYWFVQFDFPDANGKPYKTSGGKMVWSEEVKRDIPVGWSALTLDEIGNITGGSTPSRDNESYFTTSGTAWITPKDLSLNTGNKFIKRGELDVSEKGLNSASLNVMPRGTVLMSSRAPVGYLAIARNEVTTNQGFKSFVPKSYFTTEFIYYTIKNLSQVIENNASGSTFKEVSTSVLKTIYFLAPEENVIEMFAKSVVPVFNRQELLEEENKKLAELRDWLLPMLMNGQVKVEEEKQGKFLADAELLVKHSIAKSEGILIQLTPIHDIAVPDSNLRRAMLVAQIKQRLGINYGDVAIQKTVFNIAAFHPDIVVMEYQFANHNHGTFCPQLASDLKSNPYLVKQPVKGNIEGYVLNAAYEQQVNAAMLLPEYAGYITAINETLSIYKDPLINKKTEKIELLNTVAKLIMDFKTVSLDHIYTGMQEWYIEQKGFDTKAEKFSKKDTEEMLGLIAQKGLVDVLLGD